MAGKKKITSQKTALSKEEKKQKLEKRYSEFSGEYTTQYCFLSFIASRLEKDCRPETISFYNRFFKKYTKFIEDVFKTTPEQMDIEHLTTPLAITPFRKYLESQDCNKQTVNSYLRGLRSFGNYCLKEGFIDSFECPIKEEQPDIKEVYSDRELEKLLVKPKAEEFVEFRTYCIISLLLNTGARSRTIISLKICDVDLKEGYVNFNSSTTKAHKLVRLGLERKTRRDLEEWIHYWRLDKGAEPTDYLFCNAYGEQLSRSQLDKSVAKYNRDRGVEKTSLHLLRHTFAKNWITSGGDIISLAQVLTHSDLEMVKRYANLYGTDVKKEIEEHSTIAKLKQRSGATLKNQKKRIDRDD